MRGGSNPDGRIAAPGLLRFARNDGQGIGSLVSACRLKRLEFVEPQREFRGRELGRQQIGLAKIERFAVSLCGRLAENARRALHGCLCSPGH